MLNLRIFCGRECSGGDIRLFECMVQKYVGESGSWKVCVRWHFVETGPGLFSILLSLVFFFFFGEVLSLVLTLGNIEG